MDSKGTLTMIDSLGKNCPLNILTPSKTSGLQLVTGGVFILLSLYSVLFSVKK